jgi:hypothetical protein
MLGQTRSSRGFAQARWLWCSRGRVGVPDDRSWPLIAFKGLNDSMEEIEIVFIEVKTGGSVLSTRERAVKKAVEAKRVSWRVFNPDVEFDHISTALEANA